MGNSRQTELLKKERLTIGYEKDRMRKRQNKKDNQNITRGKERSSESEDREKQRLAILKILKRGDENEFERKLRLEKVVTNKHLRLAVEIKEEQD